MRTIPTRIGNPQMTAGAPGALLAIMLVFSVFVSASQAQAAAAARLHPDESIFSRIAPNDCRAPTDAQLNEVKAAAASFQRARRQQEEARALILLASLYEQMGEYRRALEPLQRALQLVRSAKQSKAEAQVLTMTADALAQTGRGEKASQDATDALRIAARTNDLSAQASALRARAEAINTSAPEQANQDLAKAQKLADQTGDLKLQALILTDEGAIAQDANDPFETFHRALAFEDQIHDCRDEVATLDGLGTLEHDRGQIGHALDHLNQALALEARVGDHTSEALTLHQLAYFREEIGDLGSALSFFNRALQLERRAGDVTSEGPTLVALAGVYRDTQWPATALRAYQRALPLLRQTRNTEVQVWALNNIGAVDADLHHRAEARNYYNRSVRLAFRSSDPVTPAYSAWGVGELEQSDAVPSYVHAVQLAREFGQPDLEGEVYASLMNHYRAHHEPNMAIFFGKRAVDRFQSLRRNMNGIGNQLTSSFLQKKAAAYRTLAELLIEQGRLIEAQQVLDLLKVQQYTDYVGAQPSQLGQPLARSRREAPLQARFNDLLIAWVNCDQALRATKAADRQTPQSLQARSAMRAAQADFDAFLKSLHEQLQSEDGAVAAVDNVTGAELPLERLIGSESHVAALYTLEAPDRYWVIAITRKGRFAHSYPISQDALDEKCREFLAAVKTGSSGSTAPAADLYDILFAPIVRDLAAADATTLVWNLDGSLRYIPMAALYDKRRERYVVEDYGIVNFTPFDQSLDDVPRLEDTTALGMGTSGISLDGLGMLPNVPAELESVVTDPEVTESHGVLPGKILLNGQFTEAAMEKELRSQAVVHIASHFVLNPGNDDLSYLLLGGKDHDSSGYRYSMAEFEKSSNLRIQGTKLLTFSACETSASNEREICFASSRSSVTTSKCQAGAANQREDGVVMESISEVALEKGAEAVLSSLWSVDDRSTSRLMADFYRRWAGSNGTVSKAEALREAEVDLLHGKDIAEAGTNSRGLTVAEGKAGGHSGAGRLANPYYWAPFVLTGNWH